jgi:hypothetical protein
MSQRTPRFESTQPMLRDGDWKEVAARDSLDEKA